MTVRSRLRDRRRRVPPAVWCITALFAALLCLWAVAAPVYQAPDEPQHVDLVRVLADGGGWPAHTTRQVDRQVVASLDVVAFDTVLPDGLAAADAPPRGSRPSFAALGPSGPSDVYNQVTQHPPLAHAVGAVVLRVLRGVAGADAWRFDAVVVALRLVGAAFAVWLPLLAWATVRRLGGVEEAALAAAVVPLAVPQLAHSAAAVNNDALLVLLAGVATLLVTRVATGDGSWSTALALGGVTALALLVKAFALVLVPWIALAYTVAALRRRGHRGGAPTAGAVLARGAVAVAVALAGGSWWWLRNLVDGGRLLPLGGEALPSPAPGFVASVGEWQWLFRDLLTQSFWGLFGWLDVPSLPALVWPAALLTLVGAAAAVAVGPGGARRGRGRWRRADAALLLAPVVVLTAGMALRSWNDYQVLGDLVGVQGRYLFPGFVGLAAAVALGWSTLLVRGRRGLPLGVLAIAGVLQSGAAVALLAHFWTAPEAGSGLTALGAGAAALVAWAPWPAGATATVAAAVVVAAAATTVALARTPGATGASGAADALTQRAAPADVGALAQLPTPERTS